MGFVHIPHWRQNHCSVLGRQYKRSPQHPHCTSWRNGCKTVEYVCAFLWRNFFYHAILGLCNDRRIFFIATVNFICKDAAHHVLIPFLSVLMVRRFPRCHALCNLPEGLPCCVFLKNILHSFGFFLNYSCFSVCDLVAKWQISLFHFSVRSSESFIPLMSSNSIAVLLTDTFLTISVKSMLIKVCQRRTGIQYFLNLPCAFQSLFNILANGSSG